MLRANREKWRFQRLKTVIRTPPSDLCDLRWLSEQPWQSWQSHDTRRKSARAHCCHLSSGSLPSNVNGRLLSPLCVCFSSLLHARQRSRLHPRWCPIQDRHATSCRLPAITSPELTPSTPDVPNCCCLKGSAPYWRNPPFLIFDIRALWRSLLSARAPECQKLKMVGYTSMAKCKALPGSAVKGLSDIPSVYQWL